MEISNVFFTSAEAFAEGPGKVRRLLAALTEMGIPYTGLRHERADTIELCRDIGKKLGAPICKNLFLCNRQQTAFYLLILPGGKIFKTKYLSEQIGSSRLSFADGEQMERLLNCSPGSASALGLFYDTEKKVRFLIDSDLLAFDEWGFHPCDNTATLRIEKRDLLDVFLPAIGVEPTVVELPEKQGGA